MHWNWPGGVSKNCGPPWWNIDCQIFCRRRRYIYCHFTFKTKHWRFKMKITKNPVPILVADDDLDDCQMIKEALQESRLSCRASLIIWQSSKSSSATRMGTGFFVIFILNLQCFVLKVK